jgi:signal transduction histidine kinase
MNKEILKQIRVLYVEDDESIRSVLSRGLQRRVKELCVAIDGKDGLEKSRTFNPDIIVTDIKMPNMSGLDMAKIIKEEQPSIPIIITSAHGETDTLIKAIEIGINGYILKPIDKDKLFDTIITYAKIKVLEKELEEKNRLMSVQSKNAALGELLENIAHQWRQPLSIISTISGSMQLKNEFNNLEKEDIAEMTSKIIDVSQNLSDTIDYFRKTILKDTEKSESINFSKLIKDVLESLEYDLKNTQIEIILNVDDNLNLVTYRNMLFQIILNLLENSIDALCSVETKKYIFIDLEEIDNQMKLSIKDNGGGIPSDVIEHIFEPYFTTHHQCQGKGLGLHMVLQMVQNGLNGCIAVKNCEFEYNNETLKGAEFILRLK